MNILAKWVLGPAWPLRDSGLLGPVNLVPLKRIGVPPDPGL